MMKKIIVTLIIILAIAIGIYFAFFSTAKDKAPEEQFACTMEALICPDGSGVGRTGPKCEFKACPNQASFTGRLTQTENGFILITAAPEASTTEVTYAMPLQFSRISNVLAEFVGEEVVVKGAFATGNTLEVDTIEKVGAAAATTGVVKVGETQYVNGVRITLNKVESDSRCPADAVCIQAGKLVANVTLKSDTDQETVTMADTDAPRGFDTWKVSLVSADPYPLASQPVPLANYKLTFKVEKNQ